MKTHTASLRAKTPSVFNKSPKVQQNRAGVSRTFPTNPAAAQGSSAELGFSRAVLDPALNLLNH